MHACVWGGGGKRCCRALRNWHQPDAWPAGDARTCCRCRRSLAPRCLHLAALAPSAWRLVRARCLLAPSGLGRRLLGVLRDDLRRSGGARSPPFRAADPRRRARLLTSSIPALMVSLKGLSPSLLSPRSCSSCRRTAFSVIVSSWASTSSRLASNAARTTPVSTAVGAMWRFGEGGWQHAVQARVSWGGVGTAGAACQGACCLVQEVQGWYCGLVDEVRAARRPATRRRSRRIPHPPTPLRPPLPAHASPHALPPLPWPLLLRVCGSHPVARGPPAMQGLARAAAGVLLRRSQVRVHPTGAVPAGWQGAAGAVRSG